MKKTFMTFVIICMLAVLLTGCTGVNNDNNGIPDLVPSPMVSPVPDNNAPGYGNDGDLVSPMPGVSPNVPGYGNNGNPVPQVSPVPQLTQ
jgi:hypothetical protein